jgi:hypothetical protein
MATELDALLQRMQQLESELARMRDIRDIEDLVLRYSRALDWLDTDALDAVIFDDAEIDYGFFRGSGSDFKPVLMEIERSTPRRWHFTSQIKVHLQGEFADVESYNFSIGTTALIADESSRAMHFHGYYEDRVARRSGGWGIVRRKHILVSAVSLAEIPMEGQFAQLNKIGYASVQHPDYRPLKD